MVSYEFLQSRANLQARQDKEAQYLLSNIPTNQADLQAEIDKTEQERNTLGDNYAGGLHGDAAARYTIVDRRLSLLKEAQAIAPTEEQLRIQNEKLTAERNSALNTLRSGYSNSGAAIGGGKLGGGDSRGTVVSTSKFEDQQRSGYYSGTPTLDSRVTDFFSPPPSTPTRSSGSSGSSLPSSDTTKNLTTFAEQSGVRAGVKSIIPPVQNRELRGSTITARQLKQIQAGKLTEAQALSQNKARGQPRTGIATFESSKILPQVAPSSSAFLSIPGIQTASAEQVPAPPKAPRQLTQEQVNALSDSEYAAYQQEFKDYQTQYDQYARDVTRYNIIQKGDSNKKFISDVRGIVQDLYKQGHKEVNIITSSGIKTVPIGQASREAVRAGAKLQAIGPSSVNVPDGIVTGNLSNFPLGLSVFPEREQKPVGPQVGAAFGAQKEFERITGIQTGLQPITSKIDAAFETSKPKEQRSTQDRVAGSGLIKPFLGPAGSLIIDSPATVGEKLAPISNFAANYIYDPLRTGVAALQGKQVLNPNYKPGTDQTLFKPEYTTKPQETAIGNLLEGKPVNPKTVKSSLEGEVILGALTLGAGQVITKGVKGIPKIGQKISTARDVKAIGGGLSRQSDAPYKVTKISPKIFEFEQGVEAARSRTTRISSKIDPVLQIERIGKTVGAKFSKIPKRTNIPNAPKNPEPRTPYAYIEAGKKGTTAEILSRPIKGNKEELGAIIKGTLSRQERKQLGAALVSEPESPLDIYTVKATDKISKVLGQAEEAGYLKRITDIRLSSTREAAKASRKGNQAFYEKYIRNPKTIGYYETLEGVGKKTTQTTGYQTPLGSKSLNQQLRKIGLSTGEARRARSYKPIVSFGDIKVNIGTGGSVGKAQSISKQDEGILKNLLPKLAGETKKKPRQDAFGDIEKSFPYAGVYSGYEQQQYAFEPESIGSKTPYGGIVINQRSPNLIDLTNFKSRQNDELKRALNVNSAIKSIKITIPKIGVQPTTRQRQPIGLITSPIIGQTPAQKTTPLQRQTPITIPKTVPIEVPITIPDIKIPPPRRPPYEPPFKFPKGGFGFLIPGGGTGGLGRSPKARVKKFVASEADPLRAGVLVPDNVTELVGYSPAVFKQIDINLGRSRRKKGASGGIDAEPFKGFGDNLLIKNNLNIRL